MKRPLFLGIFLLFMDQVLKWFFQMNFAGKRVLVFENLGFTYMTNPGIWLDNDISTVTLVVMQVIAMAIWIFMFFLLKYYHVFYRKSWLMDLSFGFFSTAIYGNVFLDHLLFGYVRDYFINPIAISNFADISGTMALIMFIVEIAHFPKARSLLKIGTPKELIGNLKTFIEFARGRYPLKHGDGPNV